MGNRAIKLKLHAKDPRCHWCKRETVLTNIPSLSKKSTNPLMATVDHLKSRLNPERWVKRDSQEARYVLACFECNNKRSQEEIKALSAIERSKRGQGFSLNPKGNPIIRTTFKSLDEVIAKFKEHGIVLSNERISIEPSQTKEQLEFSECGIGTQSLGG